MRQPKAGDEFFPMNGEDPNYKLIIEEVGDGIIDGEAHGYSIKADDDIWYDCFWSEQNQRFQYFADGGDEV